MRLDRERGWPMCRDGCPPPAPSAGPLEMDADEYRYTLDAEQRRSLDEWMAEIFGDAWRQLLIWSVTIGEGFVEIVRYTQPPHVAHHTVTERHACRRPPPVWKPLR